MQGNLKTALNQREQFLKEKNEILAHVECVEYLTREVQVRPSLDAGGPLRFGSSPIWAQT